MAVNDRQPIAGSSRSHIAGAVELGEAHPDERAKITISVRAKKPVDVGKIISREELEAEHGAEQSDIDKVVAFAQHSGLQVVDADAGRRRVVVSGTVNALQQAFGVELLRVAHANGEYRGRTGEISVPKDLAGVVDGVFGLDDRPQAKPRFRPLASASVSYAPQQVGRAYRFPTGSDGRGQTVAIIELGGGYRPADLAHYFQAIGIPHPPQVISVSVDGAQNNPDGGDADGEVMLDIEVVGAIAPGARIVVYFAPNTDSGFLNAITKAVHDKVYQPSIMSISWGGPESSWTEQSLRRYDAALQAAAAVGMTVFAAAGDDGSSDRVHDGLAHVDFPASSPHLVACGGTSLQIGTQSQINSEVVWNNGSSGGATGGGVSDFFPLPAYQGSAHVPPSANPGGRVGRGVPDIAGDADPQTGYLVRVDGQDTVIGGTSAVAPLWAGLMALVNSQRGGCPAGFINSLLYGATDCFNDISSGNNGAYRAKSGWDACTGLGTPIGSKLLTKFPVCPGAVAANIVRFASHDHEHLGSA